MTINLETKTTKPAPIRFGEDEEEKEEYEEKVDNLSRKKVWSQAEKDKPKSRRKRSSVVIIDKPIYEIRESEKPKNSLIIRTIEPRSYSPDKVELSHRRMSEPLT
jgi:hypothetical protein